MSDVYLYNNEMWKVKYEFSYTGNKQQFHLNAGRYLCICKGANGGAQSTWFQNKGGCSYGILNLSAPLTAFAVVGGDGTEGTMNVAGEGGYNGGGRGGLSCTVGTYTCGAGGGGASDIRLSNRDVEEVQYTNQIPDGFDEVEYIESDRTQYMDIGISFTPNTRIETVFYPSSNNPSSGYPTLFGTRTAANNNALLFFIRTPYGNAPWYGCGTNETSGSTDSLPSDQWLKLVQSGNTVTWYDLEDTEVGSITSSGTLGTGGYPMYLFDLDEAGAPYPSSSANCKSYARIKYFKMWNDDQLVRYLVPFKNSGTVIDLSEFVFEQGNILDYGDSPSSTRIRTRGYIPLASGTRYLAGFPTGIKTMKVNFMTYSNEQNLIADHGWVSSGSIVDIGSNVGYVRICICNENGSDIAPSDMETFELRKYDTNIKSGLYDLVSGNMYGKSSGNDFVTGDVVSDKTVYTGTKSINIGLMSRIMVAGGAGGQGYINAMLDEYSDFTGFGGGVFGGYPFTKNGMPHNHQAPNQVSGYEFGIGEPAVDKNIGSPGSWGAEGIAGGGGGWYGGYASNVPNQSESYSSANGGGGSGYILTESSYKPDGYMVDMPARDDLYFSDGLMTSGLANGACVIICEPTIAYNSGDRIICDCIGMGTAFPLYGGTYRIKCSGGQGCHRTKSKYSRKGGYSEGLLINSDYTTAYAYVGGSSLYSASNQSADYTQRTHPTLSYNGGGSPSGYGNLQQSAEAGGGGTDLRIGTDSLYARIIVAGGAAGCGRFASYGGAGGGETGGSYEGGGYGTNYGPGTQSSAGTGADTDISGGFGYGGKGKSYSSGHGGAGGGGWYGGSGTAPDGSGDDDYGGCGGSGYVLTSESYKPDGYLLDENYYLDQTVLASGEADRLFKQPTTGMVIEVISAATSPIIAHDTEGYKYFDTVSERWTFLQTEDITVEDFEEYGTKFFTSDEGLLKDYDLYIYDEYEIGNVMVFHVIPPQGKVKFRYHTPHMISRYNIDSDVDSDVVDFDVTYKRQGVAEDAYLYFTFSYDIHDVPERDTRVYCVQGFTQGSSWENNVLHPIPRVDPPEHRDLLPVGSSTRMPARFKNYIGSFINGSEAITTINSAVVCEHNRCIYSATLCNNSVVRFAKLNLVSNTSSVIKDIPKSQIGNTFYGDIKVDDNYIYLTASTNNSGYTLWRTPNGPDTTVNAYQVTNDDSHKIEGYGRMEWYDSKTLVLLLKHGIAFFNTSEARFSYKMFEDGQQNEARRDFALGEYHMLSLYDGEATGGWVITPETGACENLTSVYGTAWAGSYRNSACYHDGKFYVVQRNRLHIVDDETMELIESVPTPFTDIDPKQIVYGNGILYITIQNKPSLYMYDISTKTFYATGLPFKIDNNTSDGWLRMCAFRGYAFIPQIRLYTINFVDRSKYNLGYKYDQFVIIMNKENSEIPDNQYEYDDRFVTFTDDNMWIHEGDIDAEMTEVDPVNHIKLVHMSKDMYNKIIRIGFKKVESDDESEGT